MGWSVFRFSLIAFALGAPLALAQFGGGPDVAVSVRTDREGEACSRAREDDHAVGAAPGGVVELLFELRIKDGGRIYSRDHEGVGQATRFELSGPGTLAEPTWPAPGGEHDLHKGLVVVRARYTVPEDAAEGSLEIAGKVVGQYCDDRVCKNIEGIPWKAVVQVDPLVVDVRARADKDRVAPGGQILVTLEYRFPRDAHVYSTDQRGQPTDFALTGKGALGAPAWPPGEKGEHHFPLEVQLVYTVPSDAAEGPWFIEGIAAGQACDPHLCWNYTTPWSVAVTIDPEGSKESVTPTPAGGTSLLGLVLPAIGMGLLTLLMPCTFPMIPITISVFTKGGQTGRGLALSRGLVYGAGIVASYTLLGLAFDLIFGRSLGQDKIQQFALNPWLNLAIAAFFIYFAGAFFGFYELKLPEFVTSRAAAGQSAILGGMTLPGLFLLGTLFMITSYSCGAPFVFSLFATAATSPTSFAVTFALLVFSATLALPFVVLSLVPNLLHSMSSSGTWMTSFKVVLGFLEIAFAMKFLSNTDIWFGRGFPWLLSREIFLGAWVVISLGIIIYLLGRVRFPHEEPVAQVGRGRAAWALAFAGIAGYLGFGIVGNPLFGDLEGFLPQVPHGGIEYAKTWEEALARAAAEKKEIFINFTGHT